MRPTPQSWWRSPIVHLAAAPVVALVWFAVKTAHLRPTDFRAVPGAVVALVGSAPVETGLGYIFALVLGVPILLVLRHQWASPWWWWFIALLWLFVVAVFGMAGMLPAPVVVIEAAACLVLLIHTSLSVGPTARQSVRGHDRGA